MVKKIKKSKKLWNLTTNFEYWAYFAYFGPPQRKIFFSFLNALGLPHTFVKSFWKSGKNWNFGDFLKILTFSSFFSNDKIILRKKLHNFFDFGHFLTTLDPLEKKNIYFFLNALGRPNILVKRSWKSGKNWWRHDLLIFKIMVQWW